LPYSESGLWRQRETGTFRVAGLGIS
jgi:hypothetical protein